MPWREDGRLLLRKLETALTEGKTAIELTDKDLRDFDNDGLPPLPDAFQVMAVVAASSEEALAAGDFQVWLRNAGGPSGARLLGRFCHADDELRRHVESHLRAEEALEPEAVFAEIVHLPEGRLGNILFRPVLRDYEIPYLGLSGAPEERQLPLDDLRVAVAGQRIELYSERLGKRIIPRLTSAHNFTARSLGVYRFLCTLQAQGLREGMGWSWGLFENASYLPRVTSGRLVLARARWRVEEKELKKIVGKSDAALYRALQAWRQRRRMPSQGYAVVEIVDALEGDEGADARWRLALYGTDRLLMDLGFDEPTKLAVAQRMQEGFAREFQSGPGLKKQLADKLRKERESLEDLLREDRPEDHPLAPGFEIFDSRSEKQAPIVAELAERQEAGRLTSPLTELAPS